MDREIPHEVIEGTPQIVDCFARQQTPMGRTLWNRDDSTYPFLVILVKILRDIYRVSFSGIYKRFNFLIESFKMLFAPMEFEPTAWKGSHKISLPFLRQGTPAGNLPTLWDFANLGGLEGIGSIHC